MYVLTLCCGVYLCITILQTNITFHVFKAMSHLGVFVNIPLTYRIFDQNVKWAAVALSVRY